MTAGLSHSIVSYLCFKYCLINHLTDLTLVYLQSSTSRHSLLGPIVKMTSHFSFLNLPRELRNIIYNYYVQEESGYHYDYDSGKLRASDQPINLALMYTCTTIAAEMHGLALKANMITFTTVYSESEHIKAGRFDQLLEMIESSKHSALCSTNNDDLRNFKTPEIVAMLAQKFPNLQLILDGWDEENYYRWEFTTYSTELSYEARSVGREFVDEGIKLLSQDPDFVEAVASLEGTELPDFVRSPLFLRPTPEPWVIPSDNEILEINKTLPGRPIRRGRSEHVPKDFWRRIKWRYSAAAASIRFLKSISASTRLQIRKILVNEDHPSVANSECHARGLIGFCLENPQLRVERRIHLWRTVLLGGVDELTLYDALICPELYDPREGDVNVMASVGHVPSLLPRDRGSFGAWVAEAAALRAAGMPTKSFSLVFDGDPIPDRSAEIFDLFKIEVEWQAAFCQWHSEKSIVPDDSTKSWTHFYSFNVLPEVMNAIVKKESFIRCNFPVSDVWNVQDVLDRNRNLPVGVHEWGIQFRKIYMPIEAKPTAPFLGLRELRLGQLLPEEELC